MYTLSQPCRLAQGGVKMRSISASLPTNHTQSIRTGYILQRVRWHAPQSPHTRSTCPCTKHLSDHSNLQVSRYGNRCMPRRAPHRCDSTLLLIPSVISPRTLQGATCSELVMRGDQNGSKGHFTARETARCHATVLRGDLYWLCRHRVCG